MADTLYHALVLSLHQPSGNLETLLEGNESEARDILLAMERIPQALAEAGEGGRIQLALSGSLLETLSNPDFQSRVAGILDCESLLGALANSPAIDVLGGGYYHPVLPLIPPADWEAHLERWRKLARRLLFRSDFQGFWPPELGFCMEMIPLLRRFGYRFVLADDEHVQSETPMSAEELRYRPHIARFGGEEIVVVVRDRELSQAQESGMELEWFLEEVRKRTASCAFPPLVTTCTPGENSAWFRNAIPGSNFWDAFHKPLLKRARAGDSPIQPIFIKDYLDEFGAEGEVTVGPGAWNTGWHDGRNFVQWTGSQSQKDALTRVGEISQAVQAALSNTEEIGVDNPELLELLEKAHQAVLRAETSCHFFWGEAWVPRCHAELDQACEYLERASVCFP